MERTFNKFLSEYLIIKSHALGDNTTNERKKRIAEGLIELARFVEVQSPDHPTLSVINGLWDYLTNESVVALFDHILETVQVDDDKNAYLAGLSGTLLQDVLTFARPDICGHGEMPLDE